MRVRFWAIFIPFLVFITLILFFPYWLTRTQIFDFHFNETGPIGDTIGGIMGPFIAIAASILTFFAFWVQYNANEQQKKDLQVERFENKFYNLLQIHRNNVSEIGVGKSLKGRKTFISMFNELKYIYLSVVDFYEKRYSRDVPKDKISNDVLYNISYLIFFFGIGQSSTQVVHEILGKKYDGFIKSLEVYLKGCQKTWKEARKSGETIAANTEEGSFSLDISYKPCNGHMSKLSHYIRHLYQLVTFVDLSTNESFDYNIKYNYVATIRSQLSTHEQLLLYYNAISILGEPWQEGKNLLKEYCLIKSIPLPLADFYKMVIEELGDRNSHGKIMFEWLDIKSRVS